MIPFDLHNHTKYSHGVNSVKEMYDAACQKKLEVIGFSEHSPRPEIYTYSHEYRDKLNAHLLDYVNEVKELKSKSEDCYVLFGMEIDWFDKEQDFVTKACNQFDFDYLIGSIHFIGPWGFDDKISDWKRLSKEECFILYNSYFRSWKRMIESGLFDIAAHPDLIKIFSIDTFKEWILRDESLSIIESGLIALKEHDMAMEISSAGLRKACKEIYPCVPIMNLASKVGVDISFASDAHKVEDVGRDFDILESYAKQFGFHKTVFFEKNKKAEQEF